MDLFNIMCSETPSSYPSNSQALNVMITMTFWCYERLSPPPLPTPVTAWVAQDATASQVFFPSRLGLQSLYHHDIKRDTASVAGRVVVLGVGVYKQGEPGDWGDVKSQVCFDKLALVFSFIVLSCYVTNHVSEMYQIPIKCNEACTGIEVLKRNTLHYDDNNFIIALLTLKWDIGPSIYKKACKACAGI